MKIQRFLLSLLILIHAACGSMYTPRPPQVPEDAEFSRPAISTGSRATPTGHCGSSSANIKPRNFADLPGNFTVCRDPSNSYQIEIHGNFNEQFISDQLCVFPARYYPSSLSSTTDPQIISQPNISSSSMNGLPLFQCADATPISSKSGLTMKFENVTYDYVFIVRHEDRQQMLQCLWLSSPRACPPYADGRFQ